MNTFIKTILGIFIILQIGVVYVSYKNFISYKQQKTLFNDLNSANYSNKSVEFYSTLEDELPNLTFTSLPIKAMKALYYLENQPDSLNYVKSLLKKSIKDNPFLKYSEGNLSKIYYAERKFDSAYFYARESFEGLPKNAVHFAMIAKLFANNKNIDSIIYTFDKINQKPLVDVNRVFFASMNNFYISLPDSLQSEVLKKAKKAKLNFKTDNDLQFLVDNIIFTKDSVNLAVEYEKEGSKLLENNDYLNGIKFFERALKIRKVNYGYFQTLGLAYYNIGEQSKSIDYLLKLENNGIPLDPLSLYAMGINYYNIGKITTGCQYLDRSRKFGQKNAIDAYLQYCSGRN